MIHISNMGFSYRKREKLFSELNMELPPGNIYGLLGRNGAGKTTLLKIISGLLFPKSGNCEVFGFTPGDRQPEFLSDLFFLPEEFRLPSSKVKEFERMYAPFYPRFDSRQFHSFLVEFEIDKNKSVSTLSFGQKKKLMVSFCLATNARLLILDEPTNGLDIPSKSLFRKLIAASIPEECTLIISTHQVRDLSNLIDPVVILDSGEVFFHQSMASISEKLNFHHQYEAPDPDEVIYSERVPGGYMVISPNEEETATDVDLEVLFNAVIKNRDMMNRIFRKEAAYES